jgi:hypothetical protein
MIFIREMTNLTGTRYTRQNPMDMGTCMNLYPWV